MNKRERGKLGQMQISFGMIFSILLIILFISFAVYGITKFMQTANYAKVEKFKSDFQEDVDDMWKGSYSSGQELEYIIPKKIQAVCFNREDSKISMYFMPEEVIYMETFIENINIEKTLGRSSKKCFSTSEGKISMTIKKASGDLLITITE